MRPFVRLMCNIYVNLSFTVCPMMRSRCDHWTSTMWKPFTICIRQVKLNALKCLKSLLARYQVLEFLYVVPMSYVHGWCTHTTAPCFQCKQNQNFDAKGKHIKPFNSIFVSDIFQAFHSILFYCIWCTFFPKIIGMASIWLRHLPTK